MFFAISFVYFGFFSALAGGQQSGMSKKMAKSQNSQILWSEALICNLDKTSLSPI